MKQNIERTLELPHDKLDGAGNQGIEGITSDSLAYRESQPTHFNIPTVSPLSIKQYEASTRRKAVRRKRLEILIDLACDGKQVRFSQKTGIPPSYVSRMLSTPEKGGARAMSESMRDQIEQVFDLPSGWLDHDEEKERRVMSGVIESPVPSYYDEPKDEIGTSRWPVRESFKKELTDDRQGKGVQNISESIRESENEGSPSEDSQYKSKYPILFKIPYWRSKGSCEGKGKYQDRKKEDEQGELKNQTWFDRLECKPSNVIAIVAHGDSMHPYVQNGDILYFDIRKPSFESGAIYLIDHPDGHKVKVVRQSIDGAWILDTLNPDKIRYPQERIEASNASALKIKGKLVYREGVL